MNRPTSILVLAMVVCVAASYGLWLELRAERSRSHDMRAHMLELERMQAAATPGGSAAAPADLPPDAATAAAPVPKDKPIAPLEPASSKPSSSAYFEYEARLLLNPQYREARRAHRRLELAAGHIDLAESLQITQERADRLIDLLVDQELSYASSPLRHADNEEEARQRQLWLAERQREDDAAVAALLGEGKLAKWKEYQASLPTRHQVQQLRTTLSAGPEPLREDQIQPLVEAMYAEQKRVKEELSDYTGTLKWSGGMEGKSHSRRNERHAQLAAAANERIRDAAASILSPPQLETLDEMLQRQLEMQNAQNEMMRAVDGMHARGKLDVAKAD